MKNLILVLFVCGLVAVMVVMIFQFVRMCHNVIFATKQTRVTPLGDMHELQQFTRHVQNTKPWMVKRNVLSKEDLDLIRMTSTRVTNRMLKTAGYSEGVLSPSDIAEYATNVARQVRAVLTSVMHSIDVLEPQYEVTHEVTSQNTVRFFVTTLEQDSISNFDVPVNQLKAMAYSWTSPRGKIHV